jgi:hypothetical protein
MNLLRVSTLTAAIVSVLASIFLVNKNYQLDRDVESVAHRAQVAADVPDMLIYMRELRSGMERHGMTRGHTALFFKTPANDLAKLTGSITSIITRLEAIKNINQTETVYQVALDDIRGIIRELERPGWDYLVTRYWFVFVVGIGIWILPGFLSNRYYWH